MQLFYLENTPESQFELDQEESRHLIRVLRRKSGDMVDFTDGKGNHFIAVIIKDDMNACRLALRDEIKVPEPAGYFHLAIAPTKKIEKIEWCLEKCVEMGLREFTPIVTSRTERPRLKAGRLEKIAISAMKQSGQFYLPKINPLLEFTDFLESKQQNPFIAHCLDDYKQSFSNAANGQSATILIGPEGDFSQEEIQLALSKGYKAVSLGNTRLRTETAGMFACAAYQIQIQNA